MKPCFLAAFLATFIIALDNAQTYINNVVIPGPVSYPIFGKLSLQTGWKRSSVGGPDSAFEMQLQLEATKYGATDYIVSNRTIWYMGFSKDSSTPVTEMQRFSTKIDPINNKTLLTMAYGTVEKNVAEINTTKSEVLTQSFSAYIFESGLEDYENQLAPDGFW